MIRKIIEINEEKCVGCGLCANACHQSAIQVINGKAKLMNDAYCDGLGMCLPKCPTGAISLIEKETEAFETSRKNIKNKGEEHMKNTPHTPPLGCPGSRATKINRQAETSTYTQETVHAPNQSVSELNQWPVQIHLVNPSAPYMENAHVLIAADCTAYAYANIHQEFIKGRITLIGCPKLDDNDAYKEKFKTILSSNNIKSITVLRMEVPCCGGIVSAVKQAMLESQIIVPYNEVTIGIDGHKK